MGQEKTSEKITKSLNNLETELSYLKQQNNIVEAIEDELDIEAKTDPLEIQEVIKKLESFGSLISTNLDILTRCQHYPKNLLSRDKRHFMNNLEDILQDIILIKFASKITYSFPSKITYSDED